MRYIERCWVLEIKAGRSFVIASTFASLSVNSAKQHLHRIADTCTCVRCKCVAMSR